MANPPARPLGIPIVLVSTVQALSVANDRQQAAIVFETCRQMIEANPELAAMCEVGKSVKRISIDALYSFYAALSTEANTKTGWSPSLLILDEASRVPDDLYRSVRPMLAVSRGRLIALSTPFGQRGWFYEAWQSGEEWERVRVTADECPRITPEFLAEEQRALGERWYRQEYLCSFEDVVDAVFAYSDIQAALTHDVQPLFGR